MSLLLWGATPVLATEPGMEQAARHFSQGKTLYNEGRYSEAIEAFSQAYRLAPHPSALFNIARCHENLAQLAEALKFYQQALTQTKDKVEQADIAKRIHRLKSLPVKVFVTSEPSGAQVTVDGRAQPAPEPTPTMVQLVPGEHLLLLQKAGHHLQAQRVAVQPGTEQTVSATLEPLPPPCPELHCPEPACSPSVKPPLDGLHLHLSVGSAVGKTTDRSAVVGLAVQSYTTYNHLLFGASLFFFPSAQEEQRAITFNTSAETAVTANARVSQQWVLAMAEAGWVWPLTASYLYATLGLGVSSDRVVYEVDDPENKLPLDSLTTPKNAFAWSLSGGAEAALLSWLSVGLNLRGGTSIGKRVTLKDAEEETSVFPFFSLWGTLTVHL